MTTQFLISIAVVLVMLIVFGYLVHGVLLAGDYGRLPHLYRPAAEQRKYLPLMFPAQILAAIALVWLYSRVHVSGGGVAEGALFGLAIAALMTIHKFLVYYATQPMPGGTVVKQIAFDTVAAVIIGVVLGAING